MKATQQILSYWIAFVCFFFLSVSEIRRRKENWYFHTFSVIEENNGIIDHEKWFSYGWFLWWYLIRFESLMLNYNTANSMENALNCETINGPYLAGKAIIISTLFSYCAYSIMLWKLHLKCRAEMRYNIWKQ